MERYHATATPCGCFTPAKHRRCKRRWHRSVSTTAALDCAADSQQRSSAGGANNNTLAVGRKLCCSQHSCKIFLKRLVSHDRCPPPLKGERILFVRSRCCVTPAAGCSAAHRSCPYACGCVGVSLDACGTRSCTVSSALAGLQSSTVEAPKLRVEIRHQHQMRLTADDVVVAWSATVAHVFWPWTQQHTLGATSNVDRSIRHSFAMQTAGLAAWRLGQAVVMVRRATHTHRSARVC